MTLNTASAAAVAATPRRPGLETVEGEEIGRDPRNVTPTEFAELGHVAGPVLSAIRTKCIDCAGGSPAEARKCVMTACPLWPYRMATNPLRAKRELSEEERATVSERLAAGRKAAEHGA